MTMKLTYRSTVFAGFIGYITQSITINFYPLLFVTFGKQYGLSLSAITSLIVICFCAQLFIDATAWRFSRFFHPRTTVVLAQLFASLGIASLGFLPKILPPYPALIIAVLLSGLGSGLVEVMVSPIVEACPTKRKSAYMCLLHSFYCWGHVLVVLFSTLYFSLVGIEHWEYLAYLWALIPLCDMILFFFVPIYPTESEEEKEAPRAFMKNKLFWLIFAMMVCSGAAELAMSQWASELAENGLGVSKTVGDLLGPCLFAVFMGASRLIYVKLSQRVSMNRFMMGSCALCILSYVMTALLPNPILALLGCALCGFSVGIMWPGCLSKATSLLHTGGVSMF
ncbi:MAG: MFS transporter, partial [Clostridia bacterium]|nr:MFS transporter [Clostridia bacterium]